MTLTGYSLLDVKTGLYSPPFFLAHDTHALRAVSELASDKNTTPGKYPEDFVLYRLGVFDDNTGTMASISPVGLGAVSAIVAQSNNANM